MGLVLIRRIRVLRNKKLLWGVFAEFSTLFLGKCAQSFDPANQAEKTLHASLNAQPLFIKVMPTRLCDQGARAGRNASLLAAKCFGELLYEARHGLGLSLRQLAERAQIPASVLSEVENGRRPPPNCAGVTQLARALQLRLEEEQLLISLALRERTGLGLRVARTTPSHVANLLRVIARMGPQLTPAQVQSLLHTLEDTMQ